MILLGITGSIGMGKSTAARLLETMGVPVHDSDRAVHAALRSDKAVMRGVARLFPEVCDPASGAIDRKKLGQIVFRDRAALKKLEKLLHPAARRSQRDFIRSMRRLGRRVVAFDIPLLFETGAEKRLDYTATVIAPKEMQRRRVLARPNMTDEKFAMIRKTQMADGEKIRRSDFTVQTGLGRALTVRQLKKILYKIRTDHARNHPRH